ncbi:hypothetical protein M404DRAFT_998215 [Pisolithus tinctorius Marx 270]|uniref:Uncharacterized protein n=1 Tax=Pisolithus tinctorius Marx 270 TaxID=870435 RepID=A0A0C3JEI0_PISTI|nr:hypothetical protein M404DRAFT_998215 [Pisolithus tinctorius Marx 270]
MSCSDGLSSTLPSWKSSIESGPNVNRRPLADTASTYGDREWVNGWLTQLRAYLFDGYQYQMRIVDP